MIKNIMFDMDGTLINTNHERFDYLYLKYIFNKFKKMGYKYEDVSLIVISGENKIRNNKGPLTNKEVFIKHIKDNLNIDEKEIIALMDDFHNNEYNNLKKCIKKIELARVMVEVLSEKGYNLIVATNPQFSKTAIEKRLEWGNIDKNLFSYITTYDNSHYCKPNENYYMEILKNNNLNADETIMIGNDCFYDAAIEKIGVPCYIITNYVRSKEYLNNCTKKGDYNDLMELIIDLPKLN